MAFRIAARGLFLLGIGLQHLFEVCKDCIFNFYLGAEVLEHNDTIGFHAKMKVGLYDCHF